MFLKPDASRHYGCRVNDRIVWHGYHALILQNELLQIVVLIEKGTEIVQLLYKPQDIDFLWRAPNALRDSSRFVTAGGTLTSSFFDHWSGGWIEVLPNGGPACEYRGTTLGFYAETVNLPWEYRILEDQPNKVAVGFWAKTYRTPFLLEKTLTLTSGTPALYIEERLTNQGAEPMDFMWGHHPVVGAPFLDGSCRISAPPSSVQIFHDEDGPDHRMGLHQEGTWPIIQDRHGKPLDLRTVPPCDIGTMDNCYLKDFEEGWVSVQSERLGVGFGLAWDPSVFRYIWLWQALGGGLGYPWFGRTYNIGLEPWTSYPCAGLAEAVINKSASRLGPGESMDAWLTATIFTGKTDVERISKDGRVF